jgi:photosystem II stability/assembly factor-like uncharacterized protein
MSRIHTLSFPNSATGFAGGLYYIYKTTNGGLNWDVPIYESGLADLDCVDENIGYYISDRIFISANGFHNAQIQAPSGSYLKIRSRNKFTWFILGKNSSFLRTTNAGKLWMYLQQSNNQSRQLLTFCLTDTSHIYWGGENGRLVKSANNGYSWENISKDLSYDKLSYLASVHFPTIETGYATTAGNSLHKGYLYKTTNGGALWDTISTEIDYSLNSVYFTSAQTGFISANNGVIYKTLNGGYNWSIQSQNYGNFNQLHFPSSSTGYAVGNAGRIVKSTNGGSNWNMLFISDGNSLYDVHFLNDQTGYVCGASGVIFKTTNGGTNWMRQQSGVSVKVTSIFFTNESTGYASLYTTTGPLMLRTVDGGNNWIPSFPPNLGTYFSTVYFPSAATGYATGNNGAVIKTVDAGLNWYLIKIPSYQSFFDTFFTSANTGYIVGSGGAILKTTTGGE